MVSEMNIRPHSTLHMISWCIASGIMITVLSLIMISANVTSGVLDTRMIWGVAGIVGFTAGIPFGVIEGVILNRMTRHIEPPYTVDMMKSHISPLVVLFLFPMIFLSLFLLPMNNAVTHNFSEAILYTSITAVFAGLCSAFATRRYLLRLTIWSANHETRKSKSKNKNSQFDNNHLKKNGVDDKIIDPERRVSRRKNRKK